jgi:cell division protein ZapA (FtsZ GTPase activity inhibitor)
MNQTIVTLRLFDEEYQIKCDVLEVETLKSAAALLIKKTKNEQKKHSLSQANATLLAALNLCGEQLSHKIETKNCYTDDQKNKINALNLQVISALTE